jgi:outer membrane immunogenic protein
MNNFKKLSLATLMILAFSAVSINVNAQNSYGFAPGDGFKQLNFGVDVDGYGIPVYIGMDFGIADMITLGARASFQTKSSKHGTNNELTSRSTIILPSFRGDYHFSGHIEGLPEELDFYGGLSLGLVVWNNDVEYYEYNPTTGDRILKERNDSSSDLELWMQLGARYYFSEKWAANVEFGSFGNNGSIGFSYRL